MTSTAILNAVISLVSLALTGLIIPWLMTKIGTEKVKQGATKFDSYTAMAEKVVDAAYQLFDTNDARKEYAVTTLKALGVPETTINTVIEAAVKVCKVAGTAIDAVKTVETATDAVISPASAVTPTNGTTTPAAETPTTVDTAAQDAAQKAADELARLKVAATALSITVTDDMTADVIKSAIVAKVTA
jgi:hypothetical protein